MITIIENNFYYKNLFLCEPNLGKRNLYSKISKHNSYNKKFKLYKDILSYCDGNNDVVDISNILKVPAIDILNSFQILEKNKLIQKLK